MITTKTGGWLYEQEDFASIRFNAKPTNYCLTTEENIPEEVDISSWYHLEDQQRQGACQGHSITSCTEVVTTFMLGDYSQLSRACGYYMSQMISGIRGDSGSTIDAGIKLAMGEYNKSPGGICYEKDWPYPSRYSPTVPKEYLNFPKQKIGGYMEVASSSDIHNNAHKCATHIGIMWDDSIDKQAQSGILTNYNVRGGGGHSVMIASKRLYDWNGNPLKEPHSVLYNSWNLGWGYKGMALVTAKWLDQAINGKNNIFVNVFGSTPTNGTFPMEK